jgi:hypothetical protein
LVAAARALNRHGGARVAADAHDGDGGGPRGGAGTHEAADSHRR